MRLRQLHDLEAFRNCRLRPAGKLRSRLFIVIEEEFQKPHGLLFSRRGKYASQPFSHLLFHCLARHILLGVLLQMKLAPRCQGTVGKIA